MEERINENILAEVLKKQNNEYDKFIRDNDQNIIDREE